MKIFAPHATDFYKTGHIFQYPPGTQEVYSNFTCRSAKWADTLEDFDGKVVFFGLQGVVQWLLMDLWNDSFFSKPKEQVVARYKRRMDRALGPDAVPVDHIAALHDLGYLPIELKALPEGSRVNMRVPLWTIRNTLPGFFWVTNYLETQLSAECWKSITSATTAFEYRRLLEQFAKLTGSPVAFVPWQGHDFSARGMSGINDSVTSGAAHLLSFTGTDTIAALDYLEDYYFGANSPDTFLGGSVPATEHSVMCLGGEDDEIGTIRRLITETYPAGIASIVSDTWDFWRTISEHALTLRPEIMARKPDALGFAKVVFRPDSGDPVKILCGSALKISSFDSWELQRASDADYEFVRIGDAFFQLVGGARPVPVTATPAMKGAVEVLWEIFGGVYTDMGYKLLDSHVGLIYGDSINLKRGGEILIRLAEKGFASANIVFGIGSYTYQHATRDTFGTAIKATHGVVNGVNRPMFKAPKTDDGVKNSARGYLRVEKVGDDFVLHENQTREEEAQGELRTILRDGIAYGFESIETIRGRLLKPFAG